jgi:hypothetical protein
MFQDRLTPLTLLITVLVSLGLWYLAFTLLDALI